MSLKTAGQKIASGWHKRTPNGQTLIHKCMPFLLVAALASATVFAALGVRFAQQEYVTISGTKLELEAEKQVLAESKKELEQKLAETKELLDQLTLANTNAQNILDSATDTVTDKIEQLQDAYQNVEDKQMQCWVLPIQYTRCSSPYGYREHPVEGEAKFHYGVDLAAPVGTPVVAARSGTVSAATYGDAEGYYVNIDHLDGYDSRYLHMSRHIVKEGQFVQAGQIIGYCGASGMVTGPHLHFGIYYDKAAVDPSEFITFY